MLSGADYVGCCLALMLERCGKGCAGGREKRSAEQPSTTTLRSAISRTASRAGRFFGVRSAPRTAQVLPGASPPQEDPRSAALAPFEGLGVQRASLRDYILRITQLLELEIEEIIIALWLLRVLSYRLENMRPNNGIAGEVTGRRRRKFSLSGLFLFFVGLFLFSFMPSFVSLVVIHNIFIEIT